MIGSFRQSTPAARVPNAYQLKSCQMGYETVSTNTEVADTFSDCEWGDVAPFGSQHSLTTLINDMLDSESLLVSEGR
jgi:hypothetical protein